MFDVFEVVETFDRKSCIRGRATSVQTLRLVFLGQAEKDAREGALTIARKECLDLWRKLETPKQYASIRQSTWRETLAPKKKVPASMPAFTEHVAKFMLSPASISPSNTTSSLVSSIESDHPQRSHSPTDHMDNEIYEFEVIQNSTFLRVESSRKLTRDDSDLMYLTMTDPCACCDKQDCNDSVLGPLCGLFGLPLVAGYRVAGNNHRFLEKERGLRPNPYMTQEQDTKNGKGEETEMKMGEKRLHICSFYLSRRCLLSPANSPAQVVRTVLHAAIGEHRSNLVLLHLIIETQGTTVC